MRSIPIDEAIELVLQKTPTRRRVSRRPIEQAVGMVLAEDLRASTDLPPFDRVTRDGYAVRFDDLTEFPCRLEVSGELGAGATGDGIRLGHGEAVVVYTGAVLPEGADTVIPMSDVEIHGDDSITVIKKPRPQGFVVSRAQHMTEGAPALSRGTPITVAKVGLLAALGRREVALFDRPEVAIISTGNELVEPGSELTMGKVADANRFVLAAQVTAAGGQPRLLGVAPDDAHAMCDKVEQGLLSDIVLITGGSSVGRYDLAHEVVIEKLGCEAHFTSVALRPGLPTVFCTQGDRMIFCLPGNPISAFVTFELFVRPAIERIAGLEMVSENFVDGILKAPLASREDYALAQPAILTLEGTRLYADPVTWHGSGDQVSLSRADGFVILPPGESRAKGDVVSVFPLGHGCLGIPRCGDSLKP